MSEDRSLLGLIEDPNTHLITQTHIAVVSSAYSTQDLFAANMAGFEEGLALALANPALGERILGDFLSHQPEEFEVDLTSQITDYIKIWNEEKNKSNGHS